MKKRETRRQTYNEKVKRKRRGYGKEDRGDIKRFKCGSEGRDSDLTQTQRRRATALYATPMLFREAKPSRNRFQTQRRQ